MNLTWQKIVTGVGSIAAFIVMAGEVTGNWQIISDTIPIPTKSYVDEKLAGGFEPIQKLLEQQTKSITEGFAGVQWTATVDRYNQQSFQYQQLDAQLTADLKKIPANEAERRALRIRVEDLENKRQNLELLRCQIDRHDANISGC